MSTLKIYQHPIYGDVVLLSDARALESESQKLMACNKRLCSELDELEREITRLRSCVAALEAEVERLREVKLPEITKEIAARWALPYPCLIGSNEDDEWEWTKEAVDFVALLNEERKA